MQRAALYIRVSTDDQIEYSPDAQRKLLLDYARKNDIFVDDVHIYIDEGFSGRKAEKRPSFMKMIATAKTKPKPFDVILVHKFDRFARNREDSVVYKSLLKKECDIRVISITEQLEDDKFSIILESMLEAMAEYYSLNLSEEVIKGMTEKATRGGLQSRPPYGYKAKDNILVVDDAEAKVVRYIFDKFLNSGDHSVYLLAKELNTLGYKTKRGHLFENRTVKYILRNPVYCGLIAWTPTGKKDIDFKHPDTIIAEGQHEAIITKEQFDRVQIILDELEIKRKPKSRPPSEFKHWLSGLMKCSNCGSSMVYNGNKKYPGYQCRSYTGGKCSVSHSIRINKLEEAVLSDLERIFTSNKVEYRTVKKPTKNNSELEMLKSQLKKIDVKLDRAKEAYINGIDTMEEYQKNKASIFAEMNALQDKIAKYTTAKSFDDKAFKDRLKSLYDALINPNISTIEKSTCIKDVIEKIIYNKANEELEIYYYI